MASANNLNRAWQLSFTGNLFLQTAPLHLAVHVMILLVHSTLDIAGMNIAKHVIDQGSFTNTNTNYKKNPVYQSEINGQQIKLIALNEEAVNAQNLPEEFPTAELIVFLSRHSSQSGTPTLSVHTPGNIASAGLGGLPRTVSTSPANAMQKALETLKRMKQEMQLRYEVTYECTHHGPTLKVPTMFVELGSSEKQWSDQAAAAAVAQSAIEAAADFRNYRLPSALGIGGTHYNSKFTQMALNGEVAFGHMIPKYEVHQADSYILQQCIKRTQEELAYIILDWKGIRSDDKPRLMSTLQEIGLPTKKV